MDIVGQAPPGYTEWDAERHGKEKSKKDDKRSSFEIDKARIIHSSAFRRLQGKTQVFGVGERDFYRTRLTHSLEVAQIGRGMCSEVKGLMEFKIDQDLVEAICLAHDIGHAAFGHSGEKNLHELMIKHGGFGANAQNLRIVAFVESKQEFGGLNLSRAALDGLVKYRDRFSKASKVDRAESHFYYDDDEKLVNWVNGGRTYKPIECQIADWADAIAYSVNDIEDSFKAGLLNFVEVEKRADEISEKSKLDVSIVREFAKKMQLDLVVNPSTYRARKVALKRWSSNTIFELITGCKFVRSRPKEPKRYQFDLERGTEVQLKSRLLKAISRIMVFDNPRVTTLERKGDKILEALFIEFNSKHQLLPYDFQELINEKRFSPQRIVADFVSGMTDNYAYDYYARLLLPGAGSFYEFV